MSVSIHAYSRMQLVEPHEFDPDGCYESDHYRAFALSGFEQSLRGIADHDVFDEDKKILGGRCYAPTEDSDHVLVMDTGYGSYNRWREMLCRTLHGIEPRVIWNNPDQYRDAACFELINFADNEGCIGPEAAVDLLADFTEHADRLSHLAAYDDWVDGLRLAADGGFIQYR